jgi:acetyltransferase-like isoleucine patch superfamily enzyme
MGTDAINNAMTNYGKQFIAQSELRSLPFRSIGDNVLIHERVNMINIENISMGSNVRIDGDVTIVATGRVDIGSFVHIGAQCYLAGGAGIKMMDFSGLSQGVKLYSTSDDYSGAHLTNPTVPIEYLGVIRGRVELERHVIIGAGSIVLPNVTVGEGSAIGALSLVNKSVEAWGIFSGIPVRRISSRNQDLLRIEKQLIANMPLPSDSL